MQEAVPSGKGAMLVVLGLKVEEILEQINSISINGTCEIANDNSPGQIVISGDKDSIQILQDSLKKKSIRGIILPVSAPFHCSLMKSAEKKMTQKITESLFKDPKPSIISNVTAKAENKVNKIKELLIKQITSRVKWRESVEYMINNGVNEFIEIGPGKVLSGLVKRINKIFNSEILILPLELFRKDKEKYIDILCKFIDLEANIGDKLIHLNKNYIIKDGRKRYFLRSTPFSRIFYLASVIHNWLKKFKIYKN